MIEFASHSPLVQGLAVFLDDVSFLLGEAELLEGVHAELMEGLIGPILISHSRNSSFLKNSPCATGRTISHCLYTVFWYRCQFAGYGKINQIFGQVDNGFSGAAAPNRFSRGISKAHLEQHL